MKVLFLYNPFEKSNKGREGKLKERKGKERKGKERKGREMRGSVQNLQLFVESFQKKRTDSLLFPPFPPFFPQKNFETFKISSLSL